MPVPPAPSATAPDRVAALDLRMVRALPFAVVCVVVSALGHLIGGGGRVPLPALLLGGLGVWVVAVALAGRERSMRSIAAVLAVGQITLHVLFHRAAMGGMGMAGTTGMPSLAGMTGMPGMAGGPSASGLGTGGPSGSLAALAAKLLCDPTATGAASALPPGTTAAQIVGRAGIDPHLVLSTGAPQLPFWAHTAFLGLTPTMLLGHLLAALVAGWWLRRGEAAVWRLLRLTAQVTETLAQTWTAPLRTLLALAAALLRGLPGTTDPAAPAAAVRAGDRDSGRPPRVTLLRHQVIRRGPPATALPA